MLIRLKSGVIISTNNIVEISGDQSQSVIRYANGSEVSVNESPASINEKIAVEKSVAQNAPLFGGK